MRNFRMLHHLSILRGSLVAKVDHIGQLAIGQAWALSQIPEVTMVTEGIYRTPDVTCATLTS